MKELGLTMKEYAGLMRSPGRDVRPLHSWHALSQ